MDEKLTRAQLAVKALTDRALAEKRTKQLTFVDFRIAEAATSLERKVRRCAVADILLQDGDSLSAPDSGGYYPDLNLHVGPATLVAVELRVWGWEYDKYRIDPNGPDKPPYDVLEFPGEKDWARQLDIRIWYSNGKEAACQELSIHTASTNNGTPSVSRDVIAPSYAETGYEGHNQKGRSRVTQSQILELVSLATEMFEHRVKPRGVDGVGA